MAAPMDAPVPAPPPAIVEPPPVVNATFAATCPGMANEANANTIDAISSSLLTNGILGIVFTALFLVLRVFMKQYQLRLHLPFVTIKPPPMPTRGFKALFGWIPVVLSTSDAFVLRSAGLDALVLQKSFAVCVQIFVPLCVLSCSILLPVQSSQQFMSEAAADDNSFASITMANINSRSPVMWLHFFLAVLFIAYSFLLIEWHYRQYVALRQHYLHGGDDPNYWRDLHLAEADGALSGGGGGGIGGVGGGAAGGGVAGASNALSSGGARIFDVVAEARYRAVLEALDDQHRERARTLRPWERALAWLTSWTGTEDAERLRLHRAGEAAKRATMKVGGHFNLARALITGELASMGGGGNNGGASGGGGGATEGGGGDNQGRAPPADGSSHHHHHHHHHGRRVVRRLVRRRRQGAAVGAPDEWEEVEEEVVVSGGEGEGAGPLPGAARSASTVLRERLFGRVHARGPATRADGGGDDDDATDGGAAAVPPPPPPTAGGAASLGGGGGWAAGPAAAAPRRAGGISFDEPRGGGGATTDGGGDGRGMTLGGDSEGGGRRPSLLLPPETEASGPTAGGVAASSAGGGDDPFGRRITTQMDYAQRELHGEDIGSRAAPKWWSSIDTVTTQDGRLRRLTAEEAEALSQGGQAAVMLAKPSVRYRKTINTHLRTGRRVAVNAQQYAVLVTNVPEPCYPEVVEERAREQQEAQMRRAAELEARRAARSGGLWGFGGRGGQHGVAVAASSATHADPPVLPLTTTSASSGAAARPLSPVISVDGTRENDVHNLPGLLAASRSRRSPPSRSRNSSSRNDGGLGGGNGNGSNHPPGRPASPPPGPPPSLFLGAGWCGYKPGHAAASHEAVRSWVKGEEWLARHAAAGGSDGAAGYGVIADPFDAAELARKEEAQRRARQRQAREQAHPQPGAAGASGSGGGQQQQQQQDDDEEEEERPSPWRPWSERSARRRAAQEVDREAADLRTAMRQASTDPVVRDVMREQQLRDGVTAPEQGLSPEDAAAAAARRLERQRSISAGAARGWAAARRAARDGSLRTLATSPQYSLVAAVFSTLFPGDFDRVVPVFNHRAVDMALRAWDRRLGELEAAQHRYRLSGVRPTLVPPGSKKVPLRVLEAAGGGGGGSGGLAEREAVAAEEGWAAAAAAAGEGPPGGKGNNTTKPSAPKDANAADPDRHVPARVDAIDWLAADLRRLEQVVVDERARALREGFTPSWFVLFRTQKAAAVAASCNIHPLNRAGFQVHPAPGPEEVNWYALWFTHEQRVLRGWVIVPCIVFLVLVPVSLVAAAITQINAAFCTSSLSWRWYCCSRNWVARGAKSLLTGFVPTLLVLLWQGMAMPRLVFMCAQSEARHFSLSLLDRRMGEIYFLWACFNFFLGGILGGAALFTTNLLRLSQTFSSGDAMGVLNSLSAAIPASAKFFVLYMINRTLMTLPLRFLITQPGVWQAWLRLCDVFASPSERQLFLNYSIRSPRYGPEYGSMLLIALIGWAFALVCPVVLPFCTVWFAGMWLFWRYQLIYNYARKYESGGRMWPFFVSRLLICMAVMVLLTSLVLITKAALAQGVLLVVLGLISLLQFSRRLQARYAAGIDRMPLLLADAAPKARVPSTCYVPPPMLEGGLAWHPEWNRIWEWFGMPSHSF